MAGIASASGRRDSRAPAAFAALFAVLCVSIACGKVTPILPLWKRNLDITPIAFTTISMVDVRAAYIRASPCMTDFRARFIAGISVAASACCGGSRAPQLRPTRRHGTTTCSSRGAPDCRAGAREWAARRCAPASRSSCSPAGRPIGAIRAIPACRRRSISAASTTSKSVTVLWPAPVRFADGGGSSIGYKGGVILPLRIVPHEPASRSRCASSSTTRFARSSACRPRPSRACALGRPSDRSDAGARRAPKRACRSRRRSATACALSIRAVRRDTATAKPQVIGRCRRAGRCRASTCSPKARPPTGRCRCPSRSRGAPAGMQRFAFELDGLPPAPRPKGAALKLTAVAGTTRPIEVVFRLD